MIPRRGRLSVVDYDDLMTQNFSMQNQILKNLTLNVGCSNFWSVGNKIGESLFSRISLISKCRVNFFSCVTILSKSSKGSDQVIAPPSLCFLRYSIYERKDKTITLFIYIDIILNHYYYYYYYYYYWFNFLGKNLQQEIKVWRRN